MKVFCIIAFVNSFLTIVLSAQETPDCAAVQCLAPDCSKCEIPVLCGDTCCPLCVKVPGVEASSLGPVSPDCPILPCPNPRCQSDEEALAKPDECCATVCVVRPVKVDCALVDCRPLTCTEGSIPARFKDTCCPVCVKVPDSTVTSLSAPVQCLDLNCGRGEEALLQPGECCPSVCVARPCDLI